MVFEIARGDGKNICPVEYGVSGEKRAWKVENLFL